jgi:hypothetical protein
MAKTQNTSPATANDVREWASKRAAYKDAGFVQKKDNGNFVQGRLPKAVIAEFTEKTGREYVGGSSAPTAAPQTFEGKVVKFGKNGRKNTRKVTLTRQQVLEAAGLDTSRKGRLSQATIEAAFEALSETKPEAAPVEAPVEAPAEA